MPDSPIEIHLHWAALDDPVPAGNVRFGIEYTWAGLDTTFPTTTISTMVDSPIAYAAYEHKVTSFGSIPVPGAVPSAILSGRIYRDGESGIDTYDGPIMIAYVDAHFASRGVGDNFQNNPPWNNPPVV